MGDAAQKTLRADAQRNRARLLETAVRAFSADADITLDAIAREAGVGIGTLYRHFPTREALVDAAYHGELDKLCAAADELVASAEPDAALRDWMDRFVDYMTTKRGMADALKALIASGANPFADSRARLIAAVTSLLAAGVDAGALRADVDAETVLTTLSGVTLAAGEPAQRDQAGKMLDLILDGLRRR